MRSNWRGNSLAALLVAAGCAPAPVRFTSANFHALAPPRVAVLPFDNWSVDLVGPAMLRSLFEARLRERGYEVVSMEAVDARLRELGVTHGGQLKAFSPQALGSALGVEGLIYGTVEEFVMQNIGFIARRCVRLHARLVHAAGGERLWEDTGEGNWARVTFDKKEAQRIFLEGWTYREIENIFRNPLLPESKAAVQDLISRLPRRSS